jgi:hypothetical protein
MKIVKAFPPNIDQILKTFKITDHTVFAYGDTIYNPIGLPIDTDLMIHEQTHQKQQEKWGIENWWLKYIEDKEFRLIQEVEAYQNQYQFLKTVLNRKGRAGALNTLAEQLSSPLYGNIINKKEAKELIDV